jgi:histidine ammonia-lyase
MTKQKYFNYGEDHLTTGLALRIASGELTGRITPVAAEVIEKSRKRVDEIVANHQSVYGINTGLGHFAPPSFLKKIPKHFNTISSKVTV